MIDEKALSGFASDFGGEKYFTIQSVKIWEPVYEEVFRRSDTPEGAQIYPGAYFEGQSLPVAHCYMFRSYLLVRNRSLGTYGMPRYAKATHKSGEIISRFTSTEEQAYLMCQSIFEFLRALTAVVDLQDRNLLEI